VNVTVVDATGVHLFQSLWRGTGSPDRAPTSVTLRRSTSGFVGSYCPPRGAWTRMRPLDGRRVQAPPPYVADWVPVYPVGQPRTDRPPRGGSPDWCRRRLLPRAPRGGVAVIPPTRSRCRLPSGSGSSSAEKYQLPCQGPSHRRHTHGRASPPGRQPHRWKTRPTRADIARPRPASRGPRTPAQAQPHLRCRHHRARSQAIATATLADQPPKQHRPPRRVASRPRLSPPPPTAAGCTGPRLRPMTAYRWPVATPPLRALRGWRFNVAADTHSGTLTRR